MISRKIAISASVAFLLLALRAHGQTLDLPGYQPFAGDVGIDFSKTTPAITPDEARAGFESRKRAVVDLQKNWGLGVYSHNGVGFTTVANAMLAGGVPSAVDIVNRTLMDPKSNVFGAPGTDFHDATPFCARTGDYDFMLRGLIPLTYYNWDRPDLLWPETRAKLINELLSQKGSDFKTEVRLGLCGSFPETENHILMTEGSRYLTNQLVIRELQSHGQYNKDFDNEANGMNRRMLEHLQQFFKNDFSEYNSKPYQAYMVMAVQNVYEFAEDSRVKLAAEMLMNYLDGKFAVSSNGLRRYPPFRRQKGYKDKSELLQHDAETGRFIQLAGPSAVFSELKHSSFVDFSTDRMLFAGLGAYRTPDLIMDLVLDKSHVPYFEAYHHTGIELYSSSKSFLLTAGGVWVKKWDWWTGENSGWAMPTTLMPTLGGLDAGAFIRFLGNKDEKERANTCVSRGFACGLNPVIPPSIPAECLQKEGAHWTFVNFTAEACPLKYGFFAAIYQAPCDSEACKKSADSYGFLEAAEPSDTLDFARFRANVITQNVWRMYHSDKANTYVNQYGQEIQFRTITSDKLRWGIESVAGTPMQTDMNRWPLAFGDVMHADGSGLVTFENTHLHKRLILDMRDPLHPHRVIEEMSGS
jgi:hypothetical protein